MAYFQTKDGSLEESIRKAVSGIQEKIEYVEYKFKNRNDAMKAKKMLDATQLMGFEINDDNISNGEISVDAGNRDMTKNHKEIMKKFRPKVLTQESFKEGSKEEYQKFFNAAMKKFKIDSPADLKSDEEKKKFFDYVDKNYKGEKDEAYRKSMREMKKWTGLKEAMSGKDVAKRMMKIKTMKSFASKVAKMKTVSRDDLEKMLPDYIDGGDITKVLKETNEMGTPENTKSKLDVTPGQSADDWQQQVDTMQKKNASMREALAKVWGVGEGHNPFKTEDEHSPDEKKKKVKIDTKTMTGKPITKVEVDPDMREVKVGKKNVR